MKIAEMNNCIEKMREIYKFDDEKTEISLGDMRDRYSNTVEISTMDENGTEITFTRQADSLVELTRLEE